MHNYAIVLFTVHFLPMKWRLALRSNQMPRCNRPIWLITRFQKHSGRGRHRPQEVGAYGWEPGMVPVSSLMHARKPQSACHWTQFVHHLRLAAFASNARNILSLFTLTIRRLATGQINKRRCQPTADIILVHCTVQPADIKKAFQKKRGKNKKNV